MNEEASATPEALLNMVNINRLIHEPARLVITSILYAVKEADFLFLLRETGLSKGNLSSHLARLERAEYICIEKSFQGKVPRTTCALTDEGRKAFRRYRENLKRAAQSLPD